MRKHWYPVAKGETWCAYVTLLCGHMQVMGVMGTEAGG